MKRIFTIITYTPYEYGFSQKFAEIMLKNVLSELISSDSFELHKRKLNIVLEDRYLAGTRETLQKNFPTIEFHYIIDSYSEIDEWNHRLNTHIQRAAVSSGADYLMVVSGLLPVFSNSLFLDQIAWEWDINIGYSQKKSTEFLLFKKNYTPFFFRLSDSSIKTGERSKNLFQQYKKKIRIIQNRNFLTFDPTDKRTQKEILEMLEKSNNQYQRELCDCAKYLYS